MARYDWIRSPGIHLIGLNFFQHFSQKSLGSRGQLFCSRAEAGGENLWRDGAAPPILFGGRESNPSQVSGGGFEIFILNVIRNHTRTS